MEWEKDRYAFGGRLVNHKVSGFAKINTKQRKRAAGNHVRPPVSGALIYFLCMPLALRGAAVQQGGDRDRDHQDAAVEDLGDPALQAEQLKAEDARLQEVDADQGAERVEPAGLGDRGAEEERCEERE